MKTLLVIDNYDSFTHNLVQMFMAYDFDIRVFRNDRISVAQAEALCPDYLLISPGPGNPAGAGVSMPMIRTFTGKVPILGVCLGMQCLNEVMGGETAAAPMPVHGKKSRIFHCGQGLFAGLPSPFEAARYHSLMVRAVPEGLKITAKTGDGVAMGLAHPDFPVFGVQFHPESFMTEHAAALIDNFVCAGPAGAAVFSQRRPYERPTANMAQYPCRPHQPR